MSDPKVFSLTGAELDRRPCGCLRFPAETTPYGSKVVRVLECALHSSQALALAAALVADPESDPFELARVDGSDGAWLRRCAFALERIAGTLSSSLERPCDNCGSPTARRQVLSLGAGADGVEVPLCEDCALDSQAPEVRP